MNASITRLPADPAPERPDGPPPEAAATLRVNVNVAATLNEIYDAHRISALNAEYFALKAARIQFWTQIHETALAVTTALAAGTGVSNLSYMPAAWIQVMTATLATAAALLAAVKTPLGLTRKLESYTQQYCGYQRVFVMLDKLVRDIREQTALDDNCTQSWKGSREAYFELKLRDPVYVDRRVVDRLATTITGRYPPTYYFVPQ